MPSGEVKTDQEQDKKEENFKVPLAIIPIKTET